MNYCILRSDSIFGHGTWCQMYEEWADGNIYSTNLKLRTPEIRTLKVTNTQ